MPHLWTILVSIFITQRLAPLERGSTAAGGRFQKGELLLLLAAFLVPIAQLVRAPG